MEPVLLFVDELRKGIINKKLDGYHIKKELTKAMKKKLKKEVKEPADTL